MPNETNWKADQTADLTHDFFSLTAVIITWMSNINDLPTAMVLLSFFKVWDLAYGRRYRRTGGQSRNKQIF